MSHKRPTEASWDSDDDELLNDDTSGITAFRDDDIDEDALLGSDDEEMAGDIDASSVGEAIIADVDAQIKYGDEEEEQEVLDVVVDEDEEQEILGLTAGSEFDDTGYSNFSASTHPENVSLNVSQEDAEPDCTQEDLNQSMPFSIKHEDFLEETEHEGETHAEEEEEEEESDEDEDKDHRGRFKSERSDSVSLKPGSKARDNIPDTLEISAEEQARIDEMQNEMDSRRNRRRGGRNGWRGRGRFPQQGPHGMRHQNPPGLLGMRPGMIPAHGQNNQHNMFGQRPHLMPHLQQRMPLQHQQQQRQQQQQQAMRPPLIQQQQQQQPPPRPQPPYPVPNTDQPRAVIHINPHFRPRSSFSAPQTMQGPSAPHPGSVSAPVSMNQSQMSTATMSIPPVLQASSTPYQRPLMTSGWTGNQPAVQPGYIGQRLPLNQVTPQQPLHAPFQPRQVDMSQVRPQGPGLLPQNRAPNQPGGHQNQRPPNFPNNSPSISDAPWNRNQRFQNPRGYQAQHMGPPPVMHGMPPNHQHHHQHHQHQHPPSQQQDQHEPPPFQQHRPPQHSPQNQPFQQMPHNQNIPHPQPQTGPRDRFPGPHQQTSHAGFGFQGFSSPPGQQPFSHQPPRQPNQQMHQQPLHDHMMDQGAQPIQTVLRGTNTPSQRGPNQGKPRLSPQALKQKQQQMKKAGGSGSQQKQDEKLTEERKKLLMRQRRFAASGAVKVKLGTKIKLTPTKSSQSIAAANKLQIAAQRQAAGMKRRSAEMRGIGISPPKMAKMQQDIQPLIITPVVSYEDVPVKSINSAEEILNADLEERIKQQARLREIIRKKKEQSRLQRAHQHQIQEDQEGEALDKPMPPPAQLAFQTSPQKRAIQPLLTQQPQQLNRKTSPGFQQGQKMQNAGSGKKMIKLNKEQDGVQNQNQNIQRFQAGNLNQRGRGRGVMRGRGGRGGHFNQQNQEQQQPQHQQLQRNQQQFHGGQQQQRQQQPQQHQMQQQQQQRQQQMYNQQQVQGNMDNMQHGGGRARGRGRGHMNRGGQHGGNMIGRGAMNKTNTRQGQNTMQQPQHSQHQQQAMQQTQAGTHGQQGWGSQPRGGGGPQARGSGPQARGGGSQPRGGGTQLRGAVALGRGRGYIGQMSPMSHANRTVLPPGKNRRIVLGNEPVSNVVVIRNLSTSTPLQKIQHMCWEMGPVENINKRSPTECYVTFSTPDQALSFRNKYNRYMLDLSMLTIDFVPA